MFINIIVTLKMCTEFLKVDAIITYYTYTKVGYAVIFYVMYFEIKIKIHYEQECVPLWLATRTCKHTF